MGAVVLVAVRGTSRLHATAPAGHVPAQLGTPWRVVNEAPTAAMVRHYRLRRGQRPDGRHVLAADARVVVRYATHAGAVLLIAAPTSDGAWCTLVQLADRDPSVGIVDGVNDNGLHVSCDAPRSDAPGGVLLAEGHSTGAGVGLEFGQLPRNAVSIGFDLGGGRSVALPVVHGTWLWVEDTARPFPADARPRALVARDAHGARVAGIDYTPWRFDTHYKPPSAAQARDIVGLGTLGRTTIAWTRSDGFDRYGLAAATFRVVNGPGKAVADASWRLAQRTLLFSRDGWIAGESAGGARQLPGVIQGWATSRAPGAPAGFQLVGLPTGYLVLVGVAEPDSTATAALPDGTTMPLAIQRQVIHAAVRIAPYPPGSRILVVIRRANNQVAAWAIFRDGYQIASKNLTEPPHDWRTRRF